MSDTFRNRLMLAVALVLAAIYLFPLTGCTSPP